LTADAGAQGDSAAAETIRVSLQKLRQRSDLIIATLAQTAREAQSV